MPIWTVELDDGRTIELEHDTEPSESDIYSALAAYKEPETPNGMIPLPQGMPPGSVVPQDSDVPESVIKGERPLFFPTDTEAPPLPIDIPEAYRRFREGSVGRAMFGQTDIERETNLSPGTTDPGAAHLLTTAPFPFIPNPIQRPLMAAFAVQHAAATPDVMREAADAAKEGDWRRFRQAVIPYALQTGMLAGGAHGELQQLKSSRAARFQRSSEPTTSQEFVEPADRPSNTTVSNEPATTGPDPAVLDQRIAELGAKRREQGYLTILEQEQLKLARQQRDALTAKEFDLSPEDKAYLDAERDALDVEVVLKPDVPISDDQPFARRSGDYMRANRSTGQIEVFPQEYSAWLNEDLAHMTPEQKAVEVRRTLAHERIHLAGDPSGEATYWKNMTKLEQKIFERIYHGRDGRPAHFSDQLSGAEAMRYRIQQLDRMTPDELAQTVGLEHWELKSLAVLETAIRGIRTALGTKARKAQIAEELKVLDRVQNKIEFAKGIIAGGSPAAVRRNEGERLTMESEFERARIMARNRILELQKELKGNEVSDPSVKSELDSLIQDYPDWNADVDITDVSKLTPEQFAAWARGKDQLAEQNRIAQESSESELKAMAADARAEMEQIRANVTPETVQDYANAALKHQFFNEAVRQKTAPIESPAATRRGMSQKDQRKIEAAQKLMAAKLAAQGEEIPEHLQAPKYGGSEVPAAERVGAEEAGAMPRLSPADIEARAKKFIESEITPEPLTKGQRESSELPRPKYNRASFDKFMDWGERNLGKVAPEQLRDIWIDNVWSHVLNASGARLSEWRQALRLEGAFGKRSIVDAPTSPEAEATLFPGTAEAPKSIGTKENRAFAESQVRYRNKVISAVARRLVGESVRGRANYDRTDVGVDDIAFNNSKSRYGAYRSIRSDEAGRPEVLNAMLRDQARATEADPETASRRLVLLRDKQTGQAHLVSTYNDAGTQRVTDPAGPKVKGQFSRVLDAALLKHYEPIATVLLKEPIRAYRRTFESPAEFTEQIGKEAENRASVGDDFLTESPSPEMEIEGTPGLEGEGGMIQGPGSSEARALLGMNRGTLEGGRNMTDVEAGGIFNHIEAESGQFHSVDDVRRSLIGLADAASRKKLKGADRVAISGYRKAFEHLESRFPEKSYEELVDVLAQKIYDNHATSKTYDSFVSKTLAEFEAENPRVSETEPRASETARELTSEPRSQPIEGGALSTQEYRSRFQVPARERLAEQILSEPAEQISQRLQIEGERLAAEGRQEGAQESANENPAARRRGRRSITGLAQHAIETIGSPYDEWMADRIARVGGPNAQAASEGFKVIIDRAKALYGTLTPNLDKARAMAGGARDVNVPVAGRVLGQIPSPKNIKAAQWLHGFGKEWTKFAATSRTAMAIEGQYWSPKDGRNRPFHIDPKATATVDAARQANHDAGLLYQSVTPGFRASGKFQRNLTPLGYDIIQARGGDGWRKLVHGSYEANKGIMVSEYDPATQTTAMRPLKPSDVRRLFTELGDALNEPQVDMSKVDKINQDFARYLPNAITHIKTSGVGPKNNRVLGRWQEVIHSDLFNYLENTAQKAAHAKAFREQFPNTKQGKADLASVLDAVSRELEKSGHKGDLNALIKSLQGHPTDTYTTGLRDPNSNVGSALRLVNQTVGNLFAKLALTGQMFVQLPETIAGATPLFLGYRNSIRGMARLRDGTLYKQMEQQGDVNRVMYDYTFNPRSPIRSLFRLSGNVISKAFGEQMWNELQEATAASTARVVSERIQNRQLSKSEQRRLPQTLKAMGFNEADVAGMMQGDPILLNQFQRRAAAFLTGGNKAIAEGSKLGSNRLFNSIFRFQLYPMTKANQLRRVTSNMLEAWDTGKNRRAATEQFARFMFGTAAQGAMVSGIASLMFGGRLGLDIWGNEAKDEPWEFLAESYLAAMGGPLYLAWRGARYGGGLAGKAKAFTEQAGRVAFPYTLAREMLDMADGAGKYKDQGWSKRIGKFLAARTPGARAIGTGLATFGLSEDNAPLDAALKAKTQWEIKEYGIDSSDRIGPKKEGSFRMAMKQAVEALKDGNAEKYQEAVGEAALEKQAKGARKSWADIAASLRGRKALTVDNKPMDADQLELLKQRIGPEAVELLQNYDGMLEAIAETGHFVPVAK